MPGPGQGVLDAYDGRGRFRSFRACKRNVLRGVAEITRPFAFTIFSFALAFALAHPGGDGVGAQTAHPRLPILVIVPVLLRLLALAFHLVDVHGRGDRRSLMNAVQGHSPEDLVVHVGLLKELAAEMLLEPGGSISRTSDFLMA